MSFFRQLIAILLVAIQIFLFGCSHRFDATALIEQARSEMGVGKIEHAILLLGEVLTNDPENKMALELRIECFSRSRQVKERILDLKALLKLHVDSCEKRMICINDIANAYDFLLENDSAISYQLYLMEAQSLCPIKVFTRKGCFMTLSTLYHRSDQLDLALAANDSAIALGDTSAYISMIRASIFAKLGELDSAIHHQSNAIKRNLAEGKPYSGYHLTRGNLLHRKGELQSACMDWQMALDLGSDHAQVKLDSFCKAGHP